jgi:hypothetical protein
VRPMLRRLLPLVLAGLAAAAIAAPAASADPGDLFVLHAGHGTLHRAGQAGRFGLTLRDTGRVTSFADRPRRRAGEEGLRGFVRRWKALGFAADPPNAALVDAGAPKGRDVMVVTLTRPKLLAHGQAVRFRARRIKAAAGALGRFDKRADARVAVHFTGASLFIDDAPAEARPFLWSVQGLPASGVFTVHFPGETMTEAQVDGELQVGSIATFDIGSAGVSLTADDAGLSGSFFISVVPNGNTVTGNVSFPAGTSVTVIPPSGAAQILKPGKFSLPAD